MELVLGIIFGIAAIALIAVMVVETIEYRRYVKAAHSVIAFGESMQASFDSIGEHLNRNNIQTSMVGQGLISAEQQLTFMNAVLQVHSEALNLKSLSKSFELQKDMQGEINGENGVRTIPG